MYFLLSGEGATDLGVNIGGSDIAQDADFEIGPLVLFVDQIVQSRHNYSPLDSRCCGYLSETQLARLSKDLSPRGKKLALPGSRTPQETRFFFKNARALAIKAMQIEASTGNVVVAVLFRDADGTASPGRGEWREKQQSMVDGFAFEKFKRGVAMIPKPKSEAWLICALKHNPYTECGRLEDRSGNDRSPNSLKAELTRLIGETTTRSYLVELISESSINCIQITMPSFTAFREALEAAIA